MRAVRTEILRLVRPCRPLINARGLRFVSNNSNNSGPGCKLSDANQKLHPKPAIDLINQVPPIKVNGHVAVCDGGGDELGHPVEYIMLNTRAPNQIETCKYCGTRFIHESEEDH